jgi:hypothetical protein
MFKQFYGQSILKKFKIFFTVTVKAERGQEWLVYVDIEYWTVGGHRIFLPQHTRTPNSFHQLMHLAEPLNDHLGFFLGLYLLYKFSLPPVQRLTTPI